MKIDKKELIRKVAEKHQLILSEDDPLIMGVTLNEVIFDYYSQELLQRSLDDRLKDKEDFEQQLKSHEIMIKTQIQSLLGEMEHLLSRSVVSNNDVLTKVNRDKKTCALFLLASIIFSSLFFGANLWLLIK